MNLVEHLRSALSPYLLEPATRLNLAYSGGIDSQVLLCLLVELKSDYPQHSFQATHIHHGLSPNADKWQRHCQHYCQQHEIEFTTRNLELNIQSGQSVEAIARAARYKALLECTADNGVVLLAQHQDDQFETFLLQLKRGAGPKGLSSMPFESQAQRNIRLVRPLLDISKQQILDYAENHQLIWQEDESNQNLAFERNFLRHQVLPILTQQWPKIAKSVSRSAQLCAQQQQLIDEVCEQKLGAITLENGSLDVTSLLDYSELWIYQLVRHWLAQQHITMPSQAVLQQLPNLLVSSEDANPQLCWLDWQFRRFQNALYVIKQPVIIDQGESPLLVGQHLQLPHELGQLWVDTDTLSHHSKRSKLQSLVQLKVKFGGFSVKFKPHGRPQSKPLKQWFKIWKIAPWERERVIQIVLDNSLVAIVLGDQIIVAQGNESDLSQIKLTINFRGQGGSATSATYCR